MGLEFDLHCLYNVIVANESAVVNWYSGHRQLSNTGERSLLCRLLGA